MKKPSDRYPATIRLSQLLLARLAWHFEQSMIYPKSRNELIERSLEAFLESLGETPINTLEEALSYLIDMGIAPDLTSDSDRSIRIREALSNSVQSKPTIKNDIEGDARRALEFLRQQAQGKKE